MCDSFSINQLVVEKTCRNLFIDKMNETVLLQLFLIKIHEFPGKGDLRICKLSLSKIAIHSLSPRNKMTHVFNGVLFLLGRCRDDFKMYIHVY